MLIGICSIPSAFALFIAENFSGTHIFSIVCNSLFLSIPFGISGIVLSVKAKKEGCIGWKRIVGLSLSIIGLLVGSVCTLLILMFAFIASRNKALLP